MKGIIFSWFGFSLGREGIFMSNYYTISICHRADINFIVVSEMASNGNGDLNRSAGDGSGSQNPRRQSADHEPAEHAATELLPVVASWLFLHGFDGTVDPRNLDRENCAMLLMRAGLYLL